MISSTATYALRAAVHLGMHDGLSRRSAIANATLIPQDYLLKVLKQLVDGGVVESRRGPGGGYRLTAQPEEITALQVVLAVESIPRITKCPLGFEDHERLCPLHQMLDDASQHLEESLQNTTIADLVPGRKRSQTCDFPKSQPFDVP